MPRSVVADAFGPPESLILREVAGRAVGGDEIRVAIMAAGVSFVDVLATEGKYQIQPPLPYIPGSEASGIVREVGEKVANLTVGDKVIMSGWGAFFGEETVIAARDAQRMPQGMEFAEAAVFPVSYATAWHALVDRAALRPGETVLVLGAGGATVYASVQIAKHLGAFVIGSASSEAKRALVSAGGADTTVGAGAEDWRDQVRAANKGKPVDVVFDPVGGTATDPAFRALGWGGRHLVIGFPGGIASLRTNLPLLKGASLVGVDIRQFGEREPEKLAEERKVTYELAAHGILMPAIAKRYPLHAFAAAMADAAGGKSAGRIVLEIA